MFNSVWYPIIISLINDVFINILQLETILCDAKCLNDKISQGKDVVNCSSCSFQVIRHIEIREVKSRALYCGIQYSAQYVFVADFTNIGHPVLLIILETFLERL